MRVLVILVSTVFCLGYSPIVPGTVGSAGGIAVYWLTAGLPWQWRCVLLAGVLAASVWSAGRAERLFGVKDSRRIVIDEAAGLLVALAAIPRRWDLVIAGFVLFRLFDIVKPFPARRSESLPGGLGVTTDDVVAGIYTNLTLRAWMWLSQQI